MHALHERVEHLEARIARVERPPETPPSSSFGADLWVPESAHWTKAVAWDGDVYVLGAVDGPVVAVGGDLSVGPEAHVGGHLVSLGGRIDVHPDAVVHGEQLALTSAPASTGLVAWGARRLSLFLGLATLVLLQVSLAEERTRNVADTIRHSPAWYSLGGVILAVAGIFVGSAALLSIVGSPLGIVVFGALGVAGALGMAGVCRFLGDSLPGRARTPWAAALSGAALLGLLGTTPTIGAPVVVLAGVTGLGAAAVSRLGRRPALDI